MSRPTAASLSLCTFFLLLPIVGCGDDLDGDTTPIAASGGSASGAPSTGGTGTTEESGGGGETADQVWTWPPGCPLHSEWSDVTVRELGESLPDEAKLVGVTRAPDTLETFVLLDSGALYQVTPLGAALVFEAESATLEGDAPTGAFTDVAAMGKGQFALTAPNDGYLVNVAENRMWRHFRYLPPDDGGGAKPTSISVGLTEQGVPVGQVTDALTFDASAGVLWALPRTVNTETQEFYGLELASFDADSGAPLSWLRVDRPGERPGGLSVAPAETVIGEGSLLSVYGGRLEDLSFEQNVESLGISNITGLAWGGEDACDYSLLVVDAAETALFTLGARVEGDVY